MAKRVPDCLARLPQDLDLSRGRGRPGGVARLLFVLLMAHGSGPDLFSWVGRERLARLAMCSEEMVRKALRFLEERNAIQQATRVVNGIPRRGRCIRLEPNDDAEIQIRQRLFWPRPETRAAYVEDQTLATRALLHGGIQRNYVAIIVLAYQFARKPEIETLAEESRACQPCDPNRAWIARVLGYHESTVAAALRAATKSGIATVNDRGHLVFVDPARWSDLMGHPDLPPIRPVIGPGTAANTGRYLEAIQAHAPETTDDDDNDRSDNDDPSDDDPDDNDRSDNDNPSDDDDPPDNPLEPDDDAPEHDDNAATIELELAALGFTIVEEFGREILREAVARWGPGPTRRELAAQLAGPDPTYALESLGHALGPRFECPRQLVRTLPEPDTLPNPDNVDRTEPHGACYDRPRHVRDFPDRAPPFAGPAE